MQKEMRISERVAKEFLELFRSDSLTKDMDVLRYQRYNPFIKNGKVDVDAYIEFVAEFNEFVNYKPKPFKQIIDKE